MDRTAATSPGDSSGGALFAALHAVQFIAWRYCLRRIVRVHDGVWLHDGAGGRCGAGDVAHARHFAKHPGAGFLAGFVLGLVHLFPNQNIGLEIASVLMIFTGQAWNMTFSFYSSLKSVPPELVAVSRLARMSWWERFFRLDLSFAATGLLWNSMMSMAGGWFFLMVSEAFVLGEHDFRLPGLGSYMSLAIERGDRGAQLLGVLAMLGMIVCVWIRSFGDRWSRGRINSPMKNQTTLLILGF